MDPCLCHLDSFGPDEEDTTEKNIEEIIGRRCIVKTTWEGDNFLLKGVENYTTQDRATDVTGTIVKIAASMSENIVTKEVNQIPLYFIKYDEPGPKGIPGHWYIDEEVIFL